MNGKMAIDRIGRRVFIAGKISALMLNLNNAELKRQTNTKVELCRLRIHVSELLTIFKALKVN